MSRWKWYVALVAVVVAGLVACTGDQARAGDPTTTPEAASEWPKAVFHTKDGRSVEMTVEVADTPELHTCGLMHRLEMAPDHGMLFVFEADSNGAFWNRNTFIPLTLAWIAADGTIVAITDLPNVSPEDNPQRNTLVSPQVYYRHVIEANRDYFANNGIAVGDTVDLAEAIAFGSRGAVPICREKGT